MVQVRATVDDQLVRSLSRAAQGDQAAFAQVYDQTAAQVYGLAVRVLRDRAQAEEVVQEAYLDAWRRAGDYDRNQGRVSTWLCTIAHRRAVDRVRQSQRRSDREWRDATRSEHLVEPDVADQVLRSDEQARVRTAMASLSDKQREALQVTYIDGATHREAAERLDVPLGTFKSRVRDAVTTLRSRLEEER